MIPSSDELRKAADKAEKEQDWSTAADLYRQALEILPKTRTLRHRRERLRLQQRETFCRLQAKRQMQQQKNTAQLSEEARAAAEQLQWQLAADLYQQALDVFPSFLTGELYDRHRQQLADKASRFRRQAQEDKE
ncbi:hypothetical protein [Enterobacter sp.]|jgi:tetratricopeptide (TPR) repeat protein|uniref:hypothetical protein n=1 Tax=Enterobacter sp. TaxID=42895 RepID=UPI00296F4604|nr:hypothetical protein [Enterobacter sp.]